MCGVIKYVHFNYQFLLVFSQNLAFTTCVTPCGNAAIRIHRMGVYLLHSVLGGTIAFRGNWGLHSLQNKHSLKIP